MKNTGKYEDNLNIIGKTLRKIRTEKGISYEKLSNQLLLIGINIPVTSLDRIENNQRTVRDYELCGIAKILDINVLDLLNPFIKKL